MSGACSGVSARIKELNPKAVYVHCCAHRLNLAIVDTVKALPVAEDFFALCPACRHTSIDAIASTIEAILATLKDIVDGNDRERAVEANGLLLQVNCFQFLLCLFTFQTCFA